MTALLLFTVFAAAAVLALGAIGDSWRRFGSAALALHGHLQAANRPRDLRFALITLEVRRESAKIYRPDFRPQARNRAWAPAERVAA